MSLGFDPLSTTPLSSLPRAASVTTTLTPAVATITLAGLTPVLTTTLAPSAGSITLTGVAPALTTTLAPAVGDIQFTGIVPALTTTLAPSVGSIDLTGIVPTITVTTVDETHTQGGHGKKRLRPGRHANADDYDRPYLAEYREELERFVEAKEAAKRAREAAEQRKSKVVAKQARIVAELARPEADGDTDWDSLLSAATELSKSTRLQVERVIALSDALLVRAERLEMEARQRLIDEERRSTIDRARTYELKLLLDDEEAIAFLLAA